LRIADFFLAAAERRPDAVAFVDGDTTVSYEDARSLVLRIATALGRPAKQNGQLHVAILSPNDYRITVLQLAINHADHVWVSLHTRNTTPAQIEMLRDLECDVLFFHSAFESMTREIANALPQALRLICIDRPSQVGPALEQWLGDAKEAALPGPEQPLELIMLQPTGGTTGPSKTVGHTHRSMEHCMLALIRAFSMDERSVYLAVAPLTHAGGLFALSFICSGGRVVVLPQFGVDPVFEAIAQQSVSHLFLPPTAVYALLDRDRAQDPDFSALRCFIVGAAPITPDRFKEAVGAFGPVMYEFYGQTETLGPVLHKQPEDYLQADGSFDEGVMSSAGRPIYGVRVEIMDESGAFLLPGESGEIVVRSSMIMAGYYKRPEETAAVSHHGWHHTTDVGSMDERGFVTIRDRMKDMIVSGGFNLYPLEIETVVGKHPAVFQCAVIGVPDPKWGEAVKAVVELKPGAEATEAEIIALCKAELGSLKAPKSVEFWPELPRSATGKVLKKDIRSRFWSGEWRAV
jgi:acyl-CoA synthetase (AMP-forming)/AMP-acid ligase II